MQFYLTGVSASQLMSEVRGQNADHPGHSLSLDFWVI